MTRKHHSAVVLSALMATVSSAALPASPSVTIPPTPVHPCGEKPFSAGPPVYIGHTANFEQLTRDHPEDAAELRRALVALVNRSDDEVARAVTVELRDLNPTVNYSILLTSWPPQHELTLTVNEHPYRVGLIPSYEVGAIPIPNYGKPNYDKKDLAFDRHSSPCDEFIEVVRAQTREKARRLERLKAYR